MWRKIKELFGTAPHKAEPEPIRQAGDLLGLAKSVESMIDDLTNNIYNRYSAFLLDHDITYIVPAVWGASKQGELTEDQKEIHREVAPVLTQAMAELDIKGLTPAQEFALGYIIRSLIITKIVYMLEATKRHQADQAPPFLSDVEPVGRA